MNTKTNLANMQKCPRFKRCSIPRCPLDFYMKDRIEWRDEPLCQLIAKTKSKRNRGIRTSTMGGMKSFVFKKNLK